MNRGLKILLLAAEFVLLFFGIPLLMFLDTGFSLPSVVLLPILVFILLVLRFRTDFKWKELIRMKLSKQDLLKDGIVVAACGMAIVIIVLVWFPGRLFNLPKSDPVIWLALGAFYPVFSAYPQEIIFRTYVFRRYPSVFSRKWLMIMASGTTFGFAHILYYHPLSFLLSFVAGVYLAAAYHRTGSVLYTAILHSILGMLVFTLGLGEFFWLDMYDYF